jgi:hypothetical protein
MITLNEVITEAGKNGRACPQPERWNELYELLPNRERKGMGWEPPLPLILAAWWDASIISKTIRFKEHLEWADTHGALEEIYEFLINLSEEEWYHGE